jgi:hypothetical protein
MPQKRPATVTVTAIAQVLGSGFMLLMSVLFLFLPVIQSRSRTAKPSVSLGFLHGEAAIYGVFAVLGLLTAIGLFRMKPWARYSTLVFSPMLILMGVSFAAVFVIIPMLPGHLEDLQKPGIKALVAVMMILGLGIASLGAFWLYYFNRAATRLAFANAAGETISRKGVQISGRSVPVSIAIIASLALLGVLGSIPGLFLNSPVLMFGFAVKGVAGKAVYGLLILLQLYIGIALLELKNTGRRVAIAMHSLWLLNGGILLLAPTDRLSRLIAEMPWGQAHAQSTYEFDIGSLVRMTRGASTVGIVISIVILYYLITRGWAFRDGTVAQSAAQ